MKKVLLLFLFAALCVVNNAEKPQNDQDKSSPQDDWAYEDAWYDYDLENLNEKPVEEPKDEQYEEMNTNLKETILRNADLDYQIEDNRSEPKEDADKLLENDIKDKENIINITANNTDNNSNDFFVAKDKFDVNDVKPIPLPPIGEINEDLKLLQETKEILNEDKGNDFADIDVKKDNIPDIDNIIEDSKNILADGDDDFVEVKPDDGDAFPEEAKQDLLPIPNDEDNLEGDTVDKVSKDLHEDLNNLMKVWHKLSEDSVEKKDDVSVLDYEEKNGRPFREGYIESLRNDYYDNDDDVNANEFEVNIDKTDKNIDENKNSEDQQDNIDSIIENYLIENTNKKNDNATGILARLEMVSTTLSSNDEIISQDNKIEKESTDKFLTENKNLMQTTAKTFEKVGNHDQIVEEAEKREDDDIFSSKEEDTNYGVNEEETYDEEGTSNELFGEEDKTKPKVKESTILPETSLAQEYSVTPRTMHISELNTQQYDQLMEQFQILHSEEFGPNAEKVDRNVAPKRILLEVGKPVIATSNGYPANYPTNNVNDWIFDGQGKGIGIELNITDFAVNGALGDYLLFKPGGEDDSGHDGLLFSYMLTSPRAYRFLDVDQMFVRFVANPGMPFTRGFSFTVKLIAEIPEDEDEMEIPEPEPVLPEPTETFTLFLGRVNLTDFLERQEEFRGIIADMAHKYINTNGIDRGLNTTFETTQITRVTMCNINWPGYETCMAVTVGVPLVYEDPAAEPRLTEADLKAMWNEYSSQDPFALRLRRMGISEYSIPDDDGVMTVWLVIASGVIIAMGMLAVALWRFSCFENYTRMPQFSDQDSVYNEKQGLDLYPTPHQTLPPLYESQYKWEDSKRDMDGFTNRNFNKDELYDIESDEDVIPVREKFTTDV